MRWGQRHGLRWGGVDPPVATVTSAPTLTATVNYRFVGTIVSTAPVTLFAVKVNNEPQFTVVPPPQTTFDIPLVLREGRNTIALTVADDAGGEDTTGIAVDVTQRNPAELGSETVLRLLPRSLRESP